MSISDNAAVQRQFVASPGFFGIGTKLHAGRRYLYMYGFLALLMVPIVFIGISNFSGGRRHGGARTGARTDAFAHQFKHLLPVVLVVLALAIIGAYWWHNRGKIVISASADGLTINQRAGEVYSFADARLGLWGYNDSIMGTALHLRCGAKSFVLGGRDHRIGGGTRIDEPPVPGVDAWLWAAEFEELLGMAGPRSGVEIRPPAPGDPIRCLLLRNPMLVNTTGPFGFFKQRRIIREASRAQLAIDVTADEIRVSDPHSDTVITSAKLTQVTATPAQYRYRNPWWSSYPWVEDPLRATIDAAEMRRLSVTTEVILSLPGMEDLGIACRDAAGVSETNQRRFVWRGSVQFARNPATYAASGRDWLLLVEKVGLARELEST
jgi:hypothetical protein